MNCRHPRQRHYSIADGEEENRDARHGSAALRGLRPRIVAVSK
jgi:hypothetical protein